MGARRARPRGFFPIVFVTQMPRFSVIFQYALVGHYPTILCTVKEFLVLFLMPGIGGGNVVVPAISSK